MGNRRAERSDVLQSTLILLVLRTLEARGPLHGYGIARRIEQISGNLPHLNQGTLYPALLRMEQEQWIAAEWRPSEKNRKAKVYSLTPAGLRRLGEPSIDTAPVCAFHPLTMFLVLVITAAGKTAAALEQSRQPHLALLVESRVSVPSDELGRASTDVTRILGAIGVKTDWVLEEPSPESAFRRLAGQDMSGFVVHVVIVANVSGWSSSKGVPLGVALPGTHNSGADILLFHEHIQDFSQAYRKAPWSVLALVVAHEIGHVLLPSPAHTRVGIMQTPWDRLAMDQTGERLVFTAQQGKLIRQRLSECCAVVSRR